MADPKYANLPGIDVDAPDVFETSDLPEDDQSLVKQPEELSSQCVEKISVSTDKAFKAFRGKGVHLGTTDFSDSVGKTRTSGYYADLTEYEMAEEGNKRETPQQKYHRLQHEMRELAEEVNRVKENVKQPDSSDSPVALGKQLDYLQHQLTDLHLEKLLGPEARVDVSDPQGALSQRLMTQLDSFNAPESKGKGKAAAGGDHVLYELYYRPEQAQFKKNARLAKLEERLERLENCIGKNLDKTSVLTADTENKSLIGAVSILNSKLSLLDASNTETVEARLNSVLQKMSQVEVKKEGDVKKENEPQVDLEKKEQISQLFELTKKWETTAESLPQVVERLVSLKELHEQALQFSQALSYLDTAQQEVSKNLAANSDMQKQLQDNLKDNNKLIEQNVKNIEQRLKALGK